MEKTKSFNIPKQLFVKAYKRVKANAGMAGVDEESLEDFERNLKDNLYQLWNRMSSGSYLPPPVKAVLIPKKTEGKRILGVPTVGDRICQMVVKLVFEPMVEPYFLSNSYGYRPNKSALEAVGITRQRCWKYDWVLEFDIKGLFDNIPHELLMKAVRKHTTEKWIILYIERWLKTPLQESDGKLNERNCGTPQGGVISPILSNLFLHYVFDRWMGKYHQEIPWCRYADDGLAHCQTEKQAQELLKELTRRFSECGLELHSGKTKIVYCKDGKRKRSYPNTMFDFLGYTFRRRLVKCTHRDSFFVSFTPMVSKLAAKTMRAEIRRHGLRNRTELSLREIATRYNPILRGWLNYYGCYGRSGMYSVLRHFNKSLVSWAVKKYKRFRGGKTKASKALEALASKEPKMFVHWEKGMIGGFA